MNEYKTIQKDKFKRRKGIGQAKKNAAPKGAACCSLFCESLSAFFISASFAKQSYKITIHLTSKRIPTAVRTASGSKGLIFIISAESAPPHQIVGLKIGDHRIDVNKKNRHQYF